jgi:hypothetical protein
MTDRRRQRVPLDAIVEDPTAPKALTTAIERHLAAYERVAALHADADADRRHLIDSHTAARRNEPGRILDALKGKAKVTVDDIGGSIDLLARATDLAAMRTTIMRRAADLAWAEVEREPFVDAIDEVLPWIVEHRRSTPWNRAMPTHIAYAWQRAGGNYSWHLPTLPKRHRFTRLDLVRPTEAMRRVWESIGTDDVVRLDDEGRRQRYRVVAYWDDLDDDAGNGAA